MPGQLSKRRPGLLSRSQSLPQGSSRCDSVGTKPPAGETWAWGPGALVFSESG